MVFSSLTFVCLFLPLVGALYLVLPRSASNPLLVGATREQQPSGVGGKQQAIVAARNTRGDGSV